MTERQAARGPSPAGGGRGFLSVPSTKLGWWSVTLAATFVVFFIISATVLMMPSPLILLPGLGAGIVGLLAVMRQRERSWLVWLTLLPGLLVVAFVLGELLVPH